MKNNTLKSLSLIAVASVGLIACNPLNKMKRNTDVVSFDSEPNPLEMHGDSVEVTVKGTYPTQYFHKKAKVTITPVFRKSDSTLVKEFKPMMFQGEKADGEGQVVPFTQGAKFDFTVKVPYSEDMQFGKLYARAEGSFKTKEQLLGEMEVAPGTNITPLLVMADDKPILGKDTFKRKTTEELSATINYLINSDYVRPAELRDADLKELAKAVSERTTEEVYTNKESGEEIVIGSYEFTALKVKGYASPDGEISLNDNLAIDRAESAAKSIERILTRNKIKYDKATFNQLEGKGEDWAGFKAAMEKSEIKDKELILRVLQMYDDKSKREQEIKNLAATYVEVADKILPQLRRSEIIVSVDKVGKSDDQIADFAANDPAVLNVEEMLYAATLTNDMNNKLAIYKTAAKQFPEDWRTHNNIGYIYLMQNKLNEAKAEFEKALSLNNSNAVVNNNLGVIARLNGDRKMAMDYYNKAAGAGNEVNYNKGIINIKNGNYDKAVSNMGGMKSFNTALAQLLNGDVDGALSTLDSSDEANTAKGYYLKAIIGARQENKEMVMNNLKSAIGKDASLKEKAKKDVEFLNFNLSSL